MTMTPPPSRPPALPPLPAAVHFVGIGGIGMSGLARILHAWGYRVTGSDGTASDITASLQAEGIPVTIGHTDVANAASAALVVITAAVAPGNPEVDAAIAAGVPVVKRAVILGMLANARRCIAVAGSHGKSTTSGMIATALIHLGANPSYAVGAVLSATGANAAPGSGRDMVVEADEYDRSFLTLTPDVAIINNIDYDHPDIYSNLESYNAAFVAFAKLCRPGGTLVLAADDPGLHPIRHTLADIPGIKVATFGENHAVDWRVSGMEGSTVVESPTGNTIAMPLQVPGLHNARNATAALVALVALGHKPQAAANALGTFTGVGRRFELKGEVNGIVVVDDYAHHPKEVRATLAAARNRYPDRRIVAAFQPHTYSRTKALLDDFATAFADCDIPLILDIYASRETDTLGVSSADLVALMPESTLTAGTPSDAIDTLAALVRPGDLVLTLGAGDITLVGPALLTRLAAGGPS